MEIAKKAVQHMTNILHNNKNTTGIQHIQVNA